uniref:Choline/carnitine acyltransferase domain-containing protein n=1 Tax=Phaeomonas parva TaxID=124430 RepID=A0A7S1UC64_9STRA|mmetsp:Transcript_41127/g.128958  ORF Transcript_41127/g.128958 Transcript_41127/m.128958 type:complete len:582 (+) Transcript_41127:40-1785(+)|eukprot:CAMPEP_0118884616 /NCGR_PEP_ID=MMETSP1163-20130328/23362_1 /TAXON_ID=124430 /ORGANISM="Phaeomonas parva, Strain CCMP2877" /LENGTH=581 /DNA_ID=CAMNT_0006822429 /DNA_START=324 /DNA_END=2069 /DNA_ORIENTATION=-
MERRRRLALLVLAAGLSGAPALRRPGLPRRSSAHRAASVSSNAVGGEAVAETRGLGEPLGETASWRRLGSFESVLARATVGQKLDLPHATVAILDGPAVSRAQMVDALALCAAKHPLLRARVTGTGPLDADKPNPNIRLNSDFDPLTFSPMDPALSLRDIADKVLRETAELPAGGDEEAFEGAWRSAFSDALNAWETDTKEGPLWQVAWAQQPTGGAGAPRRHAVVIDFNHAVSDQTCANTLIDDLAAALDAVVVRGGAPKAVALERRAPPSVEEAVLGPSHAPSPDFEGVVKNFSLATLRYGFFQIMNGASGAALLPPAVQALKPEERDQQGYGFSKRSTRLQHAVLEPEEGKALLARSTAEGTTVTGAFVAAVTLAALDTLQKFSGDAAAGDVPNKLRILMSLDMRRFGRGAPQEDWTKGTMACGGGATDFVLAARDGESPWELARTARKRIVDFITDPDFPAESVRLFDIGSRFLDMPKFVKEEGSTNLASLGRGYSAGVSNTGVFRARASVDSAFQIRRVHYATSHTHTGCLFQLSAVTVDNNFCLTFQTPTPLLREEEAAYFVDNTVQRLRSMIDE